MTSMPTTILVIAGVTLLGWAIGWVLGIHAGYQKGYRDADFEHDFDRCPHCDEPIGDKDEP